MKLPQHNFLMCLNMCGISMELNWLFLTTEQMIYALTLCSVHSGHHSQVTSPVALGAIGPPIWNKILGIPQFSGTGREKDTVQFEQWYHAISDAHKKFQ